MSATTSGDVDTQPAPADTPEPQAAAAQEQDEATQERPNGAGLVLHPVLPPPVQFLADTVATGVAETINGLKNTTCALARMHAARAAASLTHAQLLTAHTGWRRGGAWRAWRSRWRRARPPAPARC